MNKTKQIDGGRGRTALLMVGATLALIALAVGLVAARPRPSAPPAAQAPVPHFIDVNTAGAPRTVVIGAAHDRLPGTSNDAGYLMANLRAGQIPEGAAEAVVLSDTNCAPDAEGISHCLNDLQIGNVIVTVQHHHDMAAVPCLSPGETVRLLPLEQYRAQL